MVYDAALGILLSEECSHAIIRKSQSDYEVQEYERIYLC